MDEKLKSLLNNLENAKLTKNKNKELEIYWSLYNYHFNKNEYNKAKYYLDLIYNLKKDEKDLFYNYGLLYTILGNLEEARKYLKKELKNRKSNKKAKELLNVITVKTNFPYGTLIFFIINLISFIFINSFQELNFIQLLKYSYYKQASIFNLITSIFVHYSLLHFILNNLILLMFGLIIEKLIGSKIFILIYLISGLLGNFVQGLVPQTFVLGASGAIFGIFGIFMILNPFMKVRLLGILKISIFYLFSLFFIITYIYEIFFKSNTSYISHFIGFFTGLFITSLIYKDKQNNFFLWILFYIGLFLLYESIMCLFKKFYLEFVFNIIFSSIFIFIVEYYRRRNIK